MPAPKEEIRLARQVAAHESWARTPDRAARTAPGLAGLNARFLREADGDPDRAEQLRLAHYKRLALTSARNRRRAAEARAAAEEAEAQIAEMRSGGGAA